MTITDNERMIIMNELIATYQNILNEETILRDIYNLIKKIAKRHRIKISKDETISITIALQETEI